MGCVVSCASAFSDAWIIPSNDGRANGTDDFKRGTLSYGYEQTEVNVKAFALRYKLIKIDEPKLKQFEEYTYNTFKFGGRFINVTDSSSNPLVLFMLQRSTPDGDREDLIFDSKNEADDFYKDFRSAYLVVNGNISFFALSQPTDLNDPKSLIKVLAVGYKIKDPANPGKSLARYYLMPNPIYSLLNTDSVTTVFETN